MEKQLATPVIRGKTQFQDICVPASRNKSLCRSTRGKRADSWTQDIEELPGSAVLGHDKAWYASVTHLGTAKSLNNAARDWVVANVRVWMSGAE
jgi:hypothetical protein